MQANVSERRKVGRPIIYTGDAEDPGLTSVERRAVRRRAANRESARRVRVWRQEISDEMITRVTYMPHAPDCLKAYGYCDTQVTA